MPIRSGFEEALRQDCSFAVTCWIQIVGRCQDLSPLLLFDKYSFNPLTTWNGFEMKRHFRLTILDIPDLH